MAFGIVGGRMRALGACAMVVACGGSPGGKTGAPGAGGDEAAGGEDTSDRGGTSSGPDTMPMGGSESGADGGFPGMGGDGTGMGDAGAASMGDAGMPGAMGGAPSSDGGAPNGGMPAGDAGMPAVDGGAPSMGGSAMAGTGGSDSAGSGGSGSTAGSGGSDSAGSGGTANTAGSGGSSGSSNAGSSGNGGSAGGGACSDDTDCKGVKLGQCEAPSCDTQTGICGTKPAKDGLVCDDGHLCTSGDECQQGSCGGAVACKLSIDPNVLTLAPGDGHSYAATLTGVAPSTVTWSIQEGASGGTIDAATGDYLAPGSLATYHIVATSTADPGFSASVPVTITQDPVRVSLCPGYSTILTDDTMRMSATLSGTGNQAVAWSTSGGSIDSTGLFTPSGAGSYTITAQSVAEPAKSRSATLDVVAAILPSISGNVVYAGSKTGAIHVTLLEQHAGGTALLSPGQYRIRGVDLDKGSPVTVMAYMDVLGTGKYSLGADPAGTASFKSFSGSDITNLNLSLSDPPAVVLSAPNGVSVSPQDGFALVRYNSVRDNNSNELADEYHVYADTSASVGAGSYVAKTVIRAGTGTTALLSNLSNAVDHWFSVAAVSGGVEGPQTVIGPTQMGQALGGYSVAGTAYFSGIQVTGTLYAIAYSPSSGQIYAAPYFPSPLAGSQPFSLDGLPNGDYRLGIAIDQDDDGELGPHDPLTLSYGGNHPFTIAGSDLSGEDVTVPGTEGIGHVTTFYSDDTTSPYQLGLRVTSNTKLPLAAWIANGPNAPAPADFGIELSDNNMSLRRDIKLGQGVPAVGDSYALSVLYDDGTTCDLPTKVTGVWHDLPVLVAPVGPGAGSATPTFSWLAPASVPPYFSYELSVSTGSGSNELWRYAGASAITSVLYNSDGQAKGGALLAGTFYDWWVDAIDADGNMARATTWFSLPTPEGAEPNDGFATPASDLSACEANLGTAKVEGTLASISDVDMFSFQGRGMGGCASDPTVTTAPGVRACVYATCVKGAGAFTGCTVGTQTTVDGITACCTDLAGVKPSASYGFTCGPVPEGASANVIIHVSGGTGPYQVTYHY